MMQEIVFKENILFKLIRTAGLCFFIFSLFPLLALTTSAYENGINPPDNNQNLIVIIVDTLRADHLGCYGYDKIETPAIDGLARKGFLFSNAYCQVPITFPSHVSIFTSTYPFYHGARDNGRYIVDDGLITLAELLNQQGYRTAAFVGAFPLDSRFGLNQGFEHYDDFIEQRNQDTKRLVFAERKAEDVLQPALIWLKEKHKQKFFLWLHFFDPHSPYSPAEPFRSKYKNSLYDGEIAYVDSIIEKLFIEMEKLKIEQNTIIVLTSDHGEGLGEHEEDTHALLLYNSTLHIPLIIKAPQFSTMPAIIPHLVRSIDIMPTILDLLNINRPAKQIQGSSLVPLMLHKKQTSEPSFSYFETYYPQLNYNWSALRGIMSLEWKLILGPKPELYHLKDDPLELKNIYHQEKDKVRELREVMERTISKNTPSARPDVHQMELDAESRKKLKSLGYIASTSENRGRPINPRDMMGILKMINQAASLYRSGNYPEAIDAFNKILIKDEENIEALVYLGSCYQEINNIEKAIDSFSHALDIDAKNSSIVYKLSRCYFLKGDFDKAETGFKEVIELERNNNLAIFHLGLIAHFRGNIQEALKWFQRGLEVDERDIDCRNNLANCLLETNRLEEAIKEFKKVIQLDSSYGDAYNGLGIAYYQKGNTTQAIKWLKEAIKYLPQEAEIYFNLATILESIKEYDDALYHYQKFIQLAQGTDMQKAIDEAKIAIDRIKSLPDNY
jgi:arylsulfatase A-like enzyme/Flp pilus assembly protein TadD